MRHSYRLLACLAVTGLVVSIADAQEKAPTTFTIGGAYQLQVPAGWVVKTPRSRIIEHEFEVPVAKGDEIVGRATVMGAGGSVEANIDRWYQQFKQPDGGSTKEKAKIETKKIAGQEVTIVDLSGTYIDRPAPQAPGVDRKDFRMLAAIVQTKDAGNSYIKFYGPQRTVTENQAAFNKMLESLTAKK